MSTQPENPVSTQKPAEGRQPEFLGMPVQLDETLPPNTLEMRFPNGQIIRLENVRISSRPAAPTPAVASPIEPPTSDEMCNAAAEFVIERAKNNGTTIDRQLRRNVIELMADFAIDRLDAYYAACRSMEAELLHDMAQHWRDSSDFDAACLTCCKLLDRLAATRQQEEK